MLLQEIARGRSFDPFREMERMQNQLNRLFEGYNYSNTRGAEFPPLNIWTAPDSALVVAEVPGILPEDLDISVVNDTLTLRGERKLEELQENQSLHRRERGYGQFSRTIQLPFRIDADKVEATFKRGLLHITLPRTEQDKPRKITVQAQ